MRNRTPQIERKKSISLEDSRERLDTYNTKLHNTYKCYLADIIYITFLSIYLSWPHETLSFFLMIHTQLNTAKWILTNRSISLSIEYYKLVSFANIFHSHLSIHLLYNWKRQQFSDQIRAWIFLLVAQPLEARE